MRTSYRVGTVNLDLPLSRYSFHQPYPQGVQHGPKVWPWWKLVVVHVVRDSAFARRPGWNVWIYTRWGACCGAVVIAPKDYYR